MKTIYLVMQNSYHHDSSDKVPIYAGSSLIKANNKVAEMENRYAAWKDAKNAIALHIAEWIASNPQPKFVNPSLDDLPSFGGNREKWTDQQRIEFKSTKKKNEEKSSAAIRPLTDWTISKTHEVAEFENTFSKEIQTDLSTMTPGMTWEVIEIPFEE